MKTLTPARKTGWMLLLTVLVFYFYSCGSKPTEAKSEKIRSTPGSVKSEAACGEKSDAEFEVGKYLKNKGFNKTAKADAVLEEWKKVADCEYTVKVRFSKAGTATKVLQVFWSADAGGFIVSGL